MFQHFYLSPFNTAETIATAIIFVEARELPAIETA